jgi:hypothetical protein
MVKVNEFWEIVCEKLGYKFFSGVACVGFDPLYKKMDPAKMHYIPAVDERTAVGIVTGAAFAGIKSSVFMSADKLSELFTTVSFVEELKTSVLVFAYGLPRHKKLLAQLGVLYTSLGAKCDNIEVKLSTFDKKLGKNEALGIVLMEEGFLK